MKQAFIKVATNYSYTPGPRYISEGNFSGEEFREKFLFPLVQNALDNGMQIVVDLDGTAGYGTSFLEEAFGGLIRINKLPYEELKSKLTIVSKEEDYLIGDIFEYLQEAFDQEK